jgi:hypothetical protein
LKGDSPFHSRPARLSGTRRETTCETGSRDLISSKNESENFMAWTVGFRRVRRAQRFAVITIIHRL